MDFFTVLQLSGFQVKEAGRVFARLKDEAKNPDLREKRRWDAFDFHYCNNTNYAKFVGPRPERWEDIPVINKSKIREYNIPRIPDSNRAKRYYFRNTSGSTGKPFDYAVDTLSHALTWRILEDRYKSAGVSLNDLQARFYGFPYSFVSRTAEKLKDYVSNRVRFDTVDLSDRNMENWLDMFSRKNFAYMYGYAYPIVTFAKFLARKGKMLKAYCPTLRVVIVTSEMCTLEEQKLCEEVFGVPIYNEYGASEAGHIGFGCDGKWKLAHELMYVEILDENDRPCPHGTVGRVVLTPLFNKGTPLIRYDIGDMAAIEIDNGEEVLSKLMGRIEEMAILPSGKKVAGDTLFVYVFKEFAKVCPDITEYKVIQSSAKLFEVNISTSRELTVEELGKLKKLCLNALGDEAEVVVNCKEVLDRTLMGKFKRFERRYNPNA